MHRQLAFVFPNWAERTPSPQCLQTYNVIIERNPFHFSKSHKPAGTLMGHRQHFSDSVRKNLILFCDVFSKTATWNYSLTPPHISILIAWFHRRREQRWNKLNSVWLHQRGMALSVCVCVCVCVHTTPLISRTAAAAASHSPVHDKNSCGL